MNRTFPHFQSGLTSWARSWYERTHAGWGKLMDPGESPPLPECPWVNWIIRFYQDDALVRQDVMAGGAGAWAHYERIKGELHKRPWLKELRRYVEHHNEPTNAGCLDTPEGRRATAEYGATLTSILWNQEGIRSVAGCLGVGHPEPEHAEEVCAGPMAAALQYGGLYAFHEYGWPAMATGDGWWTLRYRKTLQALRDAGATEFPGILITEAGIDGRLVQRNEGWQKVNGDPRWYANQLQWYDSEIQRDGILGAFVFTASPNEPWASEGYEVTEALAEEMAKLWTVGPVPTPSPPPTPGGDVKYCDRDGNEIGEAAFRAIFGEGVTVQEPASSTYKVRELWDSGPEAGMDCQVYVIGDYGDNARVIVANGGTAVGSVKAPDMQEVAFWACYAPPDTGPYRVFIQEQGAETDTVHGLGWICETNHRHVQRIVYERIEEPEPPTPSPSPSPPPSPPPEEAREKIEQAQILLDEAMILLDEALALL